MRPIRRFAIVLLAAGVVTSAIYATGAFSVLTTSRNADIHVAGDASAYLALRPASGPNGQYAHQNKNGELRIVLGGSGSTGSGVNKDAVTKVNSVFTITNQGAQPVGLWLKDGSDAVTFKVGGRSIEKKENAIALAPGKTKAVSIVVDTRHVEKKNLLRSVLFHASTDVSGTRTSAQNGGENTKKAASGGHSIDTGQSKSSDSSSKQEQKQKQNDDDGGWTWTDNPLVNAGKAVLSIGSDFFSGIANWGREKLMEKFSYLTNQPLDALYSLGETAWNTLIGFAFGEFGMPGGLGFEAKEAHSPFYLIGSMLSVFNPITDTVAGLRDLAANLVKGDVLGMAIEALGLLPGGDLAGNAKDLIDITKTWVKYFSDKAAKALKPLWDMILEPVSKNSPQAKSVVLDIVGIFPDVAKRDILPGAVKRGDDSASAASKAKKKALPSGKKKKALPPGIQDLTKRDDIVGYTSKRMDRLRDEGFSKTDIYRFAEKGVDLRMVEGLSKSGVSKVRIKSLTRTDADLEIANRLGRRGFSGDQLLHIAKHGDEAYPKLTLEDAEDLMDAGYKADDIAFISKNAKQKYPVRARGVKKPKSGVTKEQLLELRRQEVPVEDVKHYVENSYSLKLVSFLREQGHSSGKIRKFFLGSPEAVKKQIERGRKIRERGSTVAAIVKDTYGWCGMKRTRGETVKTCKYLPS